MRSACFLVDPPRGGERSTEPSLLWPVTRQPGSAGSLFARARPSLQLPTDRPSRRKRTKERTHGGRRRRSQDRFLGNWKSVLGGRHWEGGEGGLGQGSDWARERGAAGRASQALASQPTSQPASHPVAPFARAIKGQTGSQQKKQGRTVGCRGGCLGRRCLEEGGRHREVRGRSGRSVEGLPCGDGGGGGRRGRPGRGEKRWGC